MAAQPSREWDHLKPRLQLLVASAVILIASLTFLAFRWRAFSDSRPITLEAAPSAVALAPKAPRREHGAPPRLANPHAPPKPGSEEQASLEAGKVPPPRLEETTSPKKGGRRRTSRAIPGGAPSEPKTDPKPNPRAVLSLLECSEAPPAEHPKVIAAWRDAGRRLGEERRQPFERCLRRLAAYVGTSSWRWGELCRKCHRVGFGS